MAKQSKKRKSRESPASSGRSRARTGRGDVGPGAGSGRDRPPGDGFVGPAGPFGPFAGGGRVRADSREECEEFLEHLVRLDAGDTDDMVRQLRTDRREYGPEEGNAGWMDGPLDAWLEHLARGLVDMDERTMAALAVGMHEVLSIRDALIISVILDEGTCDRTMLMDILSRPCTPHVHGLVRDLLTEAFADAQGPDPARCQTGVTMLTAMTCLMPHAMGAQPYAAIAYVLWWLGDCRAPLYALRSLEADDGCSLAAIVLSAFERGIEPACCVA